MIDKLIPSFFSQFAFSLMVFFYNFLVKVTATFIFHQKGLVKQLVALSSALVVTPVSKKQDRDGNKPI